MDRKTYIKEWHKAHPESRLQWKLKNPNYNKDYQQKNKAVLFIKYRDRKLKYGRDLRRKHKEFAVSKKSIPCADCNIKYAPWIMQFDHRPTEVKLFDIGNKLYSKTLVAISDEIKKCDVVCANCHHNRTYMRSHV